MSLIKYDKETDTFTATEKLKKLAEIAEEIIEVWPQWKKELINETRKRQEHQREA